MLKEMIDYITKLLGKRRNDIEKNIDFDDNRFSVLVNLLDTYTTSKG